MTTKTPKKTLVIAEKPSVAADLTKVLPGKFKKEKTHFESDTYIVSFAVGHLITIAEPGEMDERYKAWKLANLPILPDKFLTKPIGNTKAQLTALGKLIRKREVDTIINACDAGREGELIFRYIIEHVGKSRPVKKTVKRLWLQSMTKDSIKKGFENLREESEMQNLSDAAICRSEADWLIGINGSRGLTAWNSKGGGFRLTPCGRVQTPTLSLIVEREKLRLAFESKPYQHIVAAFTAEGSTYEGTWVNTSKEAKDLSAKESYRIWDPQKSLDIQSKVMDKSGTFTEKSKPKSQSCGLLYDLTSLQREANSRFGFSAKMTLGIAQALYERYKVLTYPRTDSKCLPEDYINNVKDSIKSIGTMPEYKPHAEKVLKENLVKPSKKIFNNAKISDHHAIIPTGLIPKDLPEPESKVFQMVCQRFIAIFFPAAKFNITTRITTVENESFKSEGKVLVDAGWQVVYGKEVNEEGDVIFAPLSDSTKPLLSDSEIQDFTTKPPARYSESTLLSAMESPGKYIEDEELAEALKERGLGTPATRAATIEKLLSDKYILREARELIPTRKAFDLIGILAAMEIESLSSAELTGEWEQKLTELEKGKLSREEFMIGIKDMTSDMVSKIEAFNEEDHMTPAPFEKVRGQEFLESLSAYTSKNGEIRVRKILGGRHMSPEEVHELLKNSKIGPLEGFISKKGAPFTAMIRITEENKVEFVFDDIDGENGPELLSEKPVMTSFINDEEIFETATGFISKSFLDGDKKALRLNRVILGKDIGRENALQMLAGEKSELVEGFRSSKTKRNFDAYLQLNAKGKMSFSFPPRKPRTKKS